MLQWLKLSQVVPKRTAEPKQGPLNLRVMVRDADAASSSCSADPVGTESSVASSTGADSSSPATFVDSVSCSPESPRRSRVGALGVDCDCSEEPPATIPASNPEFGLNVVMSDDSAMATRALLDNDSNDAPPKVVQAPTFAVPTASSGAASSGGAAVVGGDCCHSRPRPRGFS